MLRTLNAADPAAHARREPNGSPAAHVTILVGNTHQQEREGVLTPTKSDLLDRRGKSGGIPVEDEIANGL